MVIYDATNYREEAIMDWDEVGRAVADTLTYRIVTVAGTAVTLVSILIFVTALIGFFIAARMVGKELSRWMLGRVEDSLSYAAARIIQYVIVALGLFVSLQLLGIDLSSIAIVLGALGVGIGLGLQSIAANFVSGLILLVERPVRIGDRILVGDLEGDVVEVNMRATVVRSVTNAAVIVPNSELTGSTLVNLSHGDNRLVVVVDVGVSYRSDLETVVKALIEVAVEEDAVLRHPEPEVRLTEFGESSWNMRLLVWIADPKEHFLVRSNLNMAVVTKFRERGVEIPYPQRDVNWRDPRPFQVSVDNSR